MKKTNYTPVILGAIAAGGILLWQTGALNKLFKKKEQPKEPEVEPAKEPSTEPTVKKVVNVSPLPDPLKAPAYVAKVKELQLFLGVSPTGNALDQTNNAVKSKFGTLFASLGRVSPANIDKYLAETKKTSQNTAEYTRSLQIYNAMNVATPAKIRTDVEVSSWYYDKSDKKYKTTSGYFTAKAGQKVFKNKATMTSVGILATIPVYGKKTGDKVGDRLVKIPSSALYV
jgi:hypothetical protein